MEKIKLKKLIFFNLFMKIKNYFTSAQGQNGNYDSRFALHLVQL